MENLMSVSREQMNYHIFTILLYIVLYMSQFFYCLDKLGKKHLILGGGYGFFYSETKIKLKKTKNCHILQKRIY